MNDKATFRTLHSSYDEAAKALLSDLGVNEYEHNVFEDEMIPFYPVGVFTVSLPGISTEDLRERMKDLIENNDEYADLHHCYQTLDSGDDYKGIYEDPKDV